MKPVEVKVFVESHAAHTTQFYSGLYMLEEQGWVKVSLHPGNYTSAALIHCTINSQAVFINLADHANIDLKEYERCTYYFKRMLQKKDAETYTKLRPYGLNYPVYHKGDKSFRRSFYSKNRNFIVNTFLRSNPLLASLLKIDLGHHTARVHNFEQPPTFSKDPKAVFSARLWLPDKGRSAEKQQQRQFMNEQRIAIVREGRKKLGSKFTGGIDITAYAKQIAGDALIDSAAFSRKKSYLALLKDCSIGIANAGLEDSIGFKLAEYVCMSKAIVTSPIDSYLLPGEFVERKNFLSFDNTAEDCIRKCEELIQNESLRNEMMQHNYEYYQQYLRADKLVMNLVKTVTSV